MKQKSSFKISTFFILLCFYMHQVFKYKAYNKVLFDKKKKLWHFFSKIELQRQWSCVMCTWQGLFNARGKNFALPPPLTGRNIHSGSKGGCQKSKKHKFKFCLFYPTFHTLVTETVSDWFFFQSEHDSLTLSKVLKFLF